MDTQGGSSSAATDEMAADSIPKAEEAVDRYRRLVETDPDTHCPTSPSPSTTSLSTWTGWVAPSGR
jgi:hypothetical protein